MIFRNNFKTLSNKERSFRIANISICLVMCVFCVAMSIYYGCVYNWNNRLGSAVSMSFVCLIPVVFELITRKRLSNTVYLSVNLFIFFSGVIGAVLNVYYLVSFYDIIIHIVMGYAIALLGLFMLCRLQDHNKMRVITVAVFCLFFSLGMELLWEILERFMDLYLGQTSQGIPVSGENAPLVTDTIIDLVCNLSGALVFFAHYLIDKYTKFNLGIEAIEKDFSKGTQRNEKTNPKLDSKDKEINKTDKLDK